MLWLISSYDESNDGFLVKLLWSSSLDFESLEFYLDDSLSSSFAKRTF